MEVRGCQGDKSLVRENSFVAYFVLTNQLNVDKCCFELDLHFVFILFSNMILEITFKM